jgi:ribulose 1,5-bisphosphate synthetase/thiazole synthase
MAKELSPKTIKETLETRVVEEADVIVVGGGPGGHSAAIAAAQPQKVGC